MAYQTGTVANRFALMQVIHNFALLNGWTAMRATAEGGGFSELILRGTGAGTDQIFVGLQVFSDAINDNFGLYLNGFTGYVAESNFWSQPGRLSSANDPYPVTCPLWNSGAIQYWLTVSSRVIKCVVKVGTIYEAFHLGFLKIYGTAGQYPYPLVIGGSSFGRPSSRYSSNENHHSHFVEPRGGQTDGSENEQRSTLCIRDAAGAWVRINNTYSSVGTTVRDSIGTFPFGSVNFAPVTYNLRPALSGEYTIQPITININASGARAAAEFGEFDGVGQVAGFQNGAENTITDEDGATWLVVTNVFRTGTRDFWALKLA